MMKTSTRESELALLQQLSTKLDAHNGKPGPRTMALAPKKSSPDASENVAKNIMAVKALVKGVVKACVDEKLVTASCGEKWKHAGVIDSMVEEYRLKYPSLTRQMVTDGIKRFKRSQKDSSELLEGGKEEEVEEHVHDDQLKLGRCMHIVDEEMIQYYERIESLKRRRESAASQPSPPRKRREIADEGGESEASEPSSSSPRKRRKSSGKRAAITPQQRARETALVKEIIERYQRARDDCETPQLQNGVFEKIVEKTKRDLRMEDVDISLLNIRRRVTWHIFDAKRPRSGRAKKKDSADYKLVKEIVRRYMREREISGGGRLANGVFESIVEKTKKDHGMEDYDAPVEKIRKRVTWHLMNMPGWEKGKKSDEHKKKKEITEDVYQRFARAKLSNAGTLPRGTLESIIENAKWEHGMPEVQIGSLGSSIQKRFKKEHPEFDMKPTKKELSEEDKRKLGQQEILMTEVLSRYANAREKLPPGRNIPNGALDSIIEEAKKDLGIDLDIPKTAIRGRLFRTLPEDRIRRKSSKVTNMGKGTPHNAIDMPLVATINDWLSQGTAVTRAQGLDAANHLMKDMRMMKDDEGKDIKLDAKWWRNFIDRNRKKIVCSSDSAASAKSFRSPKK